MAKLEGLGGSTPNLQHVTLQQLRPQPGPAASGRRCQGGQESGGSAILERAPHPVRPAWTRLLPAPAPGEAEREAPPLRRVYQEITASDWAESDTSISDWLVAGRGDWRKRFRKRSATRARRWRTELQLLLP